MQDKRRLAARYAPGVILVLVALTQITLAHTTALSPWKGGGFGMFSSIERGQMRFLRVYAVRNSVEHPIQLGKAVPTGLMARAEYFPSRANLKAVARTLLDRAEANDRYPDAYRIEFWERDFDFETGDVSRDKRLEYVFRADEL